jgi:uncharacterized protein (TIGR03083 family)
MSLTPLPPTDTRPHFRPLARELVGLLRGLPPDAWERPTVAGRWRVRDVVAHLVDGHFRRLSFDRDRHTPPRPRQPIRSERDFVAFINDLNAQWVDVARRLSARVLTDLYEVAGLALADFAEGVPMDSPGLFAVSWAGEESSAGWFDLGREFTELFHHQAQIRDAVGALPAPDPAWLHATLLIALRGLPHAFGDAAGAGQAIAIVVTGDAGGLWTLTHDDRGWSLWAGASLHETARATMSDDTAWRLLFNALPADEVASLISIEGDASICGPLLRARSVIV